MKKNSKFIFTKGTLPIFILAGSAIFLALILDILRLVIFSDKQENINNNDNVFKAIHKKYPSYRTALKTLVKKDIGFSDNNYTLGNPKAKVKVVIFNDNECSICLGELDVVTRKLKPYLEDILVIYKHMPINRNKDSKAAIFGQVAIRNGVYDKFLNKLNSSKEFKTVEDYLILLEKIGIKLSKQRKIMTYDMPDIIKEVQLDIDTAVKVGAYNSKNLPVIYVNGYRLGDKFLPEHKLLTYIERLLKGDSIIPKDVEGENITKLPN